ncbi:MAG: nitrogen fixation protein FixH [Betaproteobacteria bacterium]|nr:nitrogen fixation protein FixH [Betaproteobacteria bacterium]
MSNPTTSSNTPAPWWKFGHVWLVVSGPLIVVVASFLTFYIAVRGMDPIVDENYYQAGLDINKSVVPTTAPR